MPPKKENSKVVAANERKAAAANAKAAKKAVEQEAVEAADWSKGAKGNKKELEEQKRQEQLAKKREAQRALEEEESSIKSKPSRALKGEEKKAAKKTQKVEAFSNQVKPVEEFSASNIDDALDLLTLTGSSTGGSGQAPTTTGKGKEVDRHPERRFKAAFAAYLERELPILKQEHPGLRQQQMHDMLYKQFQKSPENPFNQTNIVAYDANKEEERAHIESRKQEIANRLRT
ncbi:hypothetical protein BX616_000294 [Lobosporangium transversale]|uniref:DUF1014-domain-containing protein n=1 Tax=Lobosporangium transversale TaxID=64571 RepID=A0A1Y2GKV5_9FUNG|nr:hypothetical protein BCR41DRAFT_371367 [Lobosporangium transversale]KAF9917661.1 hypothetical protein BX616_000294 [Lobosporangium transversale]ORZ13852.1 hypothetical protein BCR41DRAFT_371367 [Lobosporangium transversale]|eukprot:XP_021880636.1 hypothetical protein BCR41DRAFT_371367 [Lobosporangium transversale]